MTDLASFGQEFGSYRVESLIGAGSLGQVFSAHRTADGRQVALKLFALNLAGGPAFQSRFGQVVGAAARLRHPNIVEIYDFGTTAGRAYLAMELLPNGSLAGLLRERAGALLPLNQGIDLARQAATALAYAHAQGIVHRDIRPENLLLARTSASYTLKVGDFGLAQLGESGGQDATGAVPGAPAYLAPEQFQGGEPDGRTDIYSLGVVLYVLATGRLPFATTTISEAMAGHIYTPPPPPHTLRPELPAELEAVILRCLAKSPAERFATADELAGALAAMLPAPAEPAPTADDDHPTFIGSPAPAADDDHPTFIGSPAPAAADDDHPTFIGSPTPAENTPTVDSDAPTAEAPIAAAPPAPASSPDATVIGSTPGVAQPAPAPAPDATVIGSTPGVAQPVVPVIPTVPPQQAPATQSLIIGTPAPGFPAMPPSKSIPQIQVLDVQGAQIDLVDLTGDGVAIGRLPGNDLVIDNDSVSERHAQIDWDGNRVSVTDLGSKNGTLLSGARLIAQVPQDWAGDKAIQIGPYWLRLVPGIPAAPPSVVIPSVTPGPVISRTGVELPATTSTPISQRVAPAPPPFVTPSLPNQSIAANSIGQRTDPNAGVQRQREIEGEPAAVSRINVALDEEALTLTPGQPSVVRMLLTNRDPAVDHFTIALIGAPKTWTVSSALPKYQVLPTQGTAAAITVTVPRTPENHAGTYPITVQARSEKNPAEAGVASAQWTVQPFEVLTLDLKPKRATGWRSAHYTATIKNAGNTPASYTLNGEDDEQALDFQFQQDKIFLDPGAIARIKLTTRSALRFFGGSQTRGFSVAAEPEAKKQAQTAIGQFIQRALIPLWLIPLLLLLLAALFIYVRQPPVILDFKAEPTAQVVGSPVSVKWQVSGNTQHVELISDIGSGLQFEATPDIKNRGEFTFGPGTAVPDDLSLVAFTRFNVTTETALKVAVQTAVPAPTAVPGPTEVPAPTAVPGPTEGQAPTAVPGPTEVIEPATSLPAATAVLTPTARPEGIPCKSGSLISIDGRNAPRGAAFLLYFDGRPVSGGTVSADGTYRATLLIQNEAPGKYPVVVRLRDGDQHVLALVTFFAAGSESMVLTSDDGSQGVQRITCIVPEITPVPTPTNGVIVFPPRAP